MTMINGVENPCSKCGKAMKGNTLFVTCKELGNVHGENCECCLPVGSGCYRKIKKQEMKA